MLELGDPCVDTVFRGLAEGVSDELGLEELTKEPVSTGLLDWQAVDVELVDCVTAGLIVTVTEVKGVPEYEGFELAVRDKVDVGVCVSRELAVATGLAEATSLCVATTETEAILVGL